MKLVPDQPRTILGLALTATIVGLVVLYVVLKWETVSDLKPHEYGEFLAGTTATLALIWVVLGYFQQSQELSENTRALRQQEDDLKAQAAHLQEMARIAAEQLAAM